MSSWIRGHGCRDRAGGYCQSSAIGTLGWEMIYLVEKRNDLVVLQQTWLLGCGLGEIADECGGWVSSLAILVYEARL